MNVWSDAYMKRFHPICLFVCLFVYYKQTTKQKANKHTEQTNTISLKHHFHNGFFILFVSIKQTTLNNSSFVFVFVSLLLCMSDWLNKWYSEWVTDWNINLNFICHFTILLFCHLPFAICHLPFAICHLPFAICHLPFCQWQNLVLRGTLRLDFAMAKWHFCNFAMAFLPFCHLRNGKWQNCKWQK